MTTSKLITVFIVPLSICCAAALTAQGAQAAEAAATETAAPLSRAEVLADLQVWRESGMAELANGDDPAVFSPRYDACMARYLALRAAPTFAALVQRIAQDRGESLIVAASK